MRIRSVFTHTAQAVAEGALIALLVVGLAAGTTFAAKGGGGGGGGGHHGGGGGTTGGGTLALVLVNDANGNGAPNWNDSVTYTVSTTATAYPYVSTQCTQNGTLVLSSSAGFFASYPWPDSQIVPLSSPSWTGGAASCTAKLYSMDSGSQVVLSTLSFSAGA